MKAFSLGITKMGKFLKSPLAAWLGAIIFYAATTSLFMGTAITACSVTIFGYPGDGSGGIGWFQWADGGGPIWGYTDKSNYPFGELLNRPQFVTSYALLVPFSLFSLITNQVCGLNIITFLAFFSTALVMFGLVRWLIKRTSIALFAGFAAAFVPYHYLQAQGHQAYAYASIFIAIIWAFLWFCNRPNAKRVALLAALFILSFYMDGYFVLLAAALVGVLFIIFILQNVFKQKESKNDTWFRIDFKQIWLNIKKYRIVIAVAALVCAILVLPILYKQLKHGAEIQQELSSSRSNIVSETMTYGTYWNDFFLPSINSVFVSGDYIQWRVKNIHDSNPAESTLYIGYVILFLMIGLLVYMLTKKGKTDPSLQKYRFTIKVSIVLIVILTLFSLPPHIEFAGATLVTPSQLLIEITEKWRVLARFFLITHVAMVILAAIGLSLLMQKFPKYKWPLFAMVFISLFIEFFPAHNYNWNYLNDTPRVYSQIANDNAVKVVAEYPIVDHPSTTLPFTFTFQQVHKKPLLNANGTTTNQGALRQSIAGLSDKQTTGVLRQLGVNVITTLDINADAVEGLKGYSAAENNPSIGKVYSYMIEPGELRPYALVARQGFVVTYDKTKLKSSLDMTNAAIMTVDPVGKETPKEGVTYKVDFTATAFNGGAQMLTIKQRDEIVWSGVVQQDTEVSFEVATTESLRLTVPGFYNTPSLSVFDMSVEMVR